MNALKDNSLSTKRQGIYDREREPGAPISAFETYYKEYCLTQSIEKHLSMLLDLVEKPLLCGCKQVSFLVQEECKDALLAQEEGLYEEVSEMLRNIALYLSTSHQYRVIDIFAQCYVHYKSLYDKIL